jgi:hypothetical protein
MPRLAALQVKTSSDLHFKAPPSPAWGREYATASVQAMVSYVSEIAEDAIAWYLLKKRRKQRWAMVLRVTAILAAAVAAMVPIFAQITSVQGKAMVAPAWASVALVAAATAVGMDRFYGFSAAWIRFVSTELRLRSALHDFHMDWQARLSPCGGSLQPEQVAPALAACRSFLAQIDTMVEAETAAWVADFSAVLKDVELHAITQAGAPRIKPDTRLSA